MSSRIILGSSSKWRRKLFQHHFPEERAEFLAPDIDEKAIRHADAHTMTLLIANSKADVLVERLLCNDPAHDALLVCMDQVVRCEGSIREKPVNSEEARAFLRSYSEGMPAECVSAVVVHHLQTGLRFAAHELATVSFAPIPSGVVDQAIAQGELFSSAGGFAIEDPLFAPFVRSIEGTREAVMGLPLDTLRALLERAGTAALSPSLAPTTPHTPGLIVRLLRPEDEDEARQLFSCGMQETITSGLRSEFRRFSPQRAASVGGLVALFASLTPQAHGALTPWHGAIGGLCLFWAVYAVVHGLIAPFIARRYIASGLQTDMRSPCARYLSRRGSAFWVAVDDASESVVGIVGVDAPSAAGDELGWRWEEGDVELRRMSVAPWARRRGVATALHAELRRFCEQWGYTRIVLSTSTLQATAHDALYPSLGYSVVGHRMFAGTQIVCTYYALPLA